MERRGANNWLVAVLALAVGFLAALLIFGGNDDSNTTAATVGPTTTTGTTAPAATTATTSTAVGGTTTTTTSTSSAQPAAPQAPQATVSNCINLWNQANNRGNQTFFANLIAHQPVRVHVGETSDVPPRCLITVVANNGDAYVFPEGAGTTYPYAQAPGSTDGSTLPAAQKTSNALEQRDGTLAGR
ncbi:MAG TPA: hypothetical protein VH300_16225 [Thermoleophilaceae bacterium]|jgi:hypothetical protein|nr:hypothetical protein [Thermoleophilaceae bacterium]